MSGVYLAVLRARGARGGRELAAPSQEAEVGNWLWRQSARPAEPEGQEIMTWHGPTVQRKCVVAATD